MSESGLGLISTFQMCTFHAYDGPPYEGRIIFLMLQLKKRIRRGREAEQVPVATQGHGGRIFGD